MTEAEEAVIVLSSAFADLVVEQTSTCLKLSFPHDAVSKNKLTVSLDFGSTLHFPLPNKCTPHFEISVTSKTLDRKICAEFKNRLILHLQRAVESHEPCESIMSAEVLVSMLCEANDLLEDVLAQSPNKETVLSIPDRDFLISWRFCAFTLDHIRDKRHYEAMMCKFASQTRLVTLLLLYHGRSIVVFIIGSLNSVQEYLKLHKTSKIDIDSRGKPCKERLLHVLVEKTIPSFPVNNVPQFTSLSVNVYDQADNVANALRPIFVPCLDMYHVLLNLVMETLANIHL